MVSMQHSPKGSRVPNMFCTICSWTLIIYATSCAGYLQCQLSPRFLQLSTRNERSLLTISFMFVEDAEKNMKGSKNDASVDGAEDLRSFAPRFDGPLIYGMEADAQGNVKTSVEDLRSKAGLLSSEAPFAARSTVCLNDPSSITYVEERKRSKIGSVSIASRSVPLGISFVREDENIHDGDNGGKTRKEDLICTVWEMEKPAELVQHWMTAASKDEKDFGIHDPFGVVMWPGSIVASQEIALKYRLDGLKGKTVLVLGAGTGVEAQAAAMLGASRVIATDVNKFTLKLLEFGAQQMGLDHVIEAKEFDIFSSDPLPKSDLVIAADVLYNEDLAKEVARRIRQILSLPLGLRPDLIVTDSQKFHGTNLLNELADDYPGLKWEDRFLKNVTGSGILVEEDQTYDVKARMLKI